MIDMFWLGLAAKMACAAAIVTAASLIVERSGPFIGSLVATMPVSAGPAFVFLAMDHGPEFISETALVSLMVVPATCTFMAVYAMIAPRLSMAASLAIGLSVWVAGVVVLREVEWTILPLALLNLVWLPVLAFMTRHLTRIRTDKATARRWWDLPLRALSVTAVVAAVILLAHAVGPRAAGYATLAPVVMVSLALIVHPRSGGRAITAVFASSISGMIGISLALIALQQAAVPLGSAAALALSLAICISWNLMLLAIHRRLARA